LHSVFGSVSICSYAQSKPQRPTPTGNDKKNQRPVPKTEEELLKEAEEKKRKEEEKNAKEEAGIIAIETNVVKRRRRRLEQENGPDNWRP
jgi:hypothetical protein